MAIGQLWSARRNTECKALALQLADHIGNPNSGSCTRLQPAADVLMAGGLQSGFLQITIVIANWATAILIVMVISIIIVSGKRGRVFKLLSPFSGFI